MIENHDPSASAADAAMLRAAAETVDEASRRLDLRVESLHYEGPAADHFKAVMSERHRRAHRAVAGLRELAAQVGGGVHGS